MSLEEKAQLSLIILLTGLVVVFAMLVFLTFIIKGYGAIVRSIEAKIKGKDTAKAAPAAPMAFVPAEMPSEVAAPVVEGGVPDEVVAAISAAVYTMYGTSVSTVKSIRRAAKSTCSAWGMAGLFENTRPF